MSLKGLLFLHRPTKSTPAN